MEGCPLKALRTGAGRNVSLPRWLALHLRTLCSRRTYQCPSQGPSSQAVVLHKLPFDCVTAATCGSWLNFPESPGPSFFVLFKEKKKVPLSFCVFPLLGWQSTQAECGGKGPAAAKPAGRGVEWAGRPGCHLQAVPFQRLQSGTGTGVGHCSWDQG